MQGLDRIVSTADLKKYNLNSVFNKIYVKKAISKQEIAHELNLSLPTVSLYLKELLESGMVIKGGQYSSTGGRKAQVFNIASTAKIGIGLEITRKFVRICFVDLYGNSILYQKKDINFISNNTYYDSVCDWINDEIKKSKINKKNILGVGIAIQGIVSQDNKTVLYSPLLSTDIKADDFYSRLNIPCIFAHDVELAATAETWFLKDVDNAIYISLNRNLGAAIISNGSIYHGSKYCSGTIEHMTLHQDGKKCYCGKKGCVETYCSADSLMEEAKEDIDTFFVNLRNNKAKEKEIWDKYLQNFALVINNVLMVYRSKIIIGGFLQTYLIREDINTLIKYISKITFFGKDDINIMASTCGETGTSIGGGLYFINKYLDTYR